MPFNPGIQYDLHGAQQMASARMIAGERALDWAEREQEQRKRDAQEFNALATLAEHRGWAPKGQAKLLGLGALRGLADAKALERGQQIYEANQWQKERERKATINLLSRLAQTGVLNEADQGPAEVSPYISTDYGPIEPGTGSGSALEGGGGGMGQFGLSAGEPASAAVTRFPMDENLPGPVAPASFDLSSYLGPGTNLSVNPPAAPPDFRQASPMVVGRLRPPELPPLDYGELAVPRVLSGEGTATAGGGYGGGPPESATPRASFIQQLAEAAVAADYPLNPALLVQLARSRETARPGSQPIIYRDPQSGASMFWNGYQWQLMPATGAPGGAAIFPQAAEKDYYVWTDNKGVQHALRKPVVKKTIEPRRFDYNRNGRLDQGQEYNDFISASQFGAYPGMALDEEAPANREPANPTKPTKPPPVSAPMAAPAPPPASEPFGDIKAAKPKPPDEAQLTTQARDAIRRGADPVAVAREFQRLTGKELF